ncbi:MAG: ribokinase [Sphingomonas sp.]|jgi:ribokinase|uniref:ribokinase n=1 Tax=Sphingomonas sp. TaxID=28214 RepID=UPI00356B253A
MTTRHGTVLVAGSANADFVVRAPRIPAPGETVLGEDLAIIPGGKGANQAVACARAGGGATRMLVALGDDTLAPMIEASLRAAGVMLDVITSDRPTGAALITVSHDGENAITVAPGANAQLRPGDLPSLDGVSHLLMQLETPLYTVMALAVAARAAGVTVMLNAAPARPLPEELLATLDMLVVNEEELARIVGDGGSVADRLAATGVPCAIVTLGGRGCCALAEGAFFVQPAFAVSPIDTTAAGDTFCGVLAATLAAGHDLAQALRTASAAGALATTRPGAQTSIPTAAAVATLLVTSDDPGRSAALADYCGVTPYPGGTDPRLQGTS